MYRKLAPFLLLFLAACIIAPPRIEQPRLDPGPRLAIDAGLTPELTLKYPAKVTIVCALAGEATDVTLGKYDKASKHHGAFTATEDLQTLIMLPERDVAFASIPGLDECFDEAEQFVTDQLPSAWTIVKSEFLTGHCYRGHAWRPCESSVDPFETYAFPLKKGGAVKFEWFSLIDPSSSIERKVDMNFFVVVHSP